MATCVEVSNYCVVGTQYEFMPHIGCPINVSQMRLISDAVFHDSCHSRLSGNWKTNSNIDLISLKFDRKLENKL